MVSSTTPRFDDKWPPFLETHSIMVPLISRASSFNSLIDSLVKSDGVLIRFRYIKPFFLLNSLQSPPMGLPLKKISLKHIMPLRLTFVPSDGTLLPHITTDKSFFSFFCPIRLFSPVPQYYLQHLEHHQ